MLSEAEVTEAVAFRRGIDAGNYANAYQGTDLDAAWEAECAECGDDAEGTKHPAYRPGFVLGFWGSYENEEIPEEHLEEFIEARETWGEHCHRHGIAID